MAISNENLSEDPKWPGCSPEQIQQARKDAIKHHPENIVVISLKYVKFALPYEEGIKVMQLLKNTEIVSSEIAYNYLKIIPIELNTISMEILPYTEYVEYKMRTLLKITEIPHDPF